MRKFGSRSDILVKEVRSLRKSSGVRQGLAAAANGGGFMESCLSSPAGSASDQSSEARCGCCTSTTFLLRETAGIHALVAVGLMQSMSLNYGLLCEYACFLLVCLLAVPLVQEAYPRSFSSHLFGWSLAKAEG